MSVDVGSAATGADDTRVVETRDEAVTTTTAPDTAEPVNQPGRERRGFAWVMGSFVLCPCHLPLTLGLLVTVTAGTAFGALLREHIVVAGVVTTTAWAFGLWRGLRSLRQPAVCAAPGVSRHRGRLMRGFLGLPSDDSRPPRR